MSDVNARLVKRGKRRGKVSKLSWMKTRRESTWATKNIRRHLTETTALNINILKDKEFEKSRKVLASKRKSLVNEAGKGNRPYSTRVLTDEEEKSCSRVENLEQVVRRFFKEQCGYCSTLWFSSSRWKSEIALGDVILEQDRINGQEMLVWLAERGTKTRNGQEKGHQRAFQPKVYANGTERCPVKFCKLFKSHRPAEMNLPRRSIFSCSQTWWTKTKQQRMVLEGAVRKERNWKVLVESCRESRNSGTWFKNKQPFCEEDLYFEATWCKHTRELCGSTKRTQKRWRPTILQICQWTTSARDI